MSVRILQTIEPSAVRACVVLTVVLSLVLAVLATPVDAWGQDLSDIPGAFADVGVGADAVGMGGAVVGSVDGATALFWNPAGLTGGERTRAFLLTHCKQMGLVPYSAGAARFNAGDYTFGAGLLYSGDDVLSETTLLIGASRGLPTVPWTPSGSASAGLTVRTRWASYGNNQSDGPQVSGTAFGLGLDVGAMIPLTEYATLGVTGRDVISLLNWDSSSRGSYEESVPAVLVTGLALSPRDQLLLEVDLDKSLHSDNPNMVRAGAELSILDVAVARGGYSTALSDKEPEEYSVGAGIHVEAGTTVVTVDLAYLFGRLDNTLRLSLGVDI